MSNIKVKRSELKTITNTLSDDERKLQEELKNMMGLMMTLEDIWQGDEANKFYEKAENYINFLNFLPFTYHTLLKIMKDANKEYKEIDSAYAEEMKKAVVKHE